jgi:very-short-patch-repair endonuclease
LPEIPSIPHAELRIGYFGSEIFGVYPRMRRRRLIALYSRHRSQDKFAQAALMRINPTPAEERMWAILTEEVIPNFPKHRFFRQYVRFGYIMDFYCPTLQICIEMDGGIHDDRKDYDEKRDKNLRRNGITVVHFRNEKVFNKPMKVADKVCQCIEAKTIP